MIDAQGLYKSALVTALARGIGHGLDCRSAREPAATVAYRRRHAVARNQHAIARVRALFAAALGYDRPTTAADYGIHRKAFLSPASVPSGLVFLHGTAWATKLWPVGRWRGLAQLAADAGLDVRLPWHSAGDRARANAIASGVPGVRSVETPTLTAAAELIASARAAIAVDTGLGHLAAALGVPTVSLYGPTSPALIGTQGDQQAHIVSDRACAPCRSRTCLYVDVSKTPPPCLAEISETRIWAQLQALIETPAGFGRAAQ